MIMIQKNAFGYEEWKNQGIWYP